MTAERWERIKDIFDSALERSAEKRASFVESACAGDEALRQQVMNLLGEIERADETKTFLNDPVARLSNSLSPGEMIASRYRVVHLLGRGGMGEVYEVHDQFLEETVALKTLRSELCYDQGLLRRFQAEIHLSRKVTHPNVCRVFEVGVHEWREPGRPPLHFFTMQLLEGETLAARIRREGRLSRREAWPLIAQMAQGLQAAHSQGIIHRDFKSANVMVTENCAVITDFGLAGLEAGAAAGAAGGAGSISMGAKLAGTVPYMSPEQLSGGPITPASDIYSLGIVLFEMATGQLPFDDRHIIHSAMQRVRGEAPSVRALAPDVDPRWEAAIRRCLELEPARRFASAAELAAVFEEAHWTLPRLYWTRRQYALAAAGAAIPLALGGTWWVRSRRPYQPKPEALVWYQRGVEALRAVTYEAARRDLDKAVATDPHYAPAYADLAAAYGELDQSERAKDAILQAVSIAQDERLSERDGDRVKAIEYVIARDFDRAQPLFEKLLAIAPQQEKAGAYVDLGWLAFKREDNAGMMPPLERALALNPDYAGAKLRLAIAVDRQGKKAAALKLFEEAEGLFQTASDYDGELEAIEQRAISLGRAGRLGEAIGLIRRAMGLAASTGDHHHQIRLELALALVYRNAGDFNLSREAAERAVKEAEENQMDSTAAIGLIDLGNAYSLRGEPEAAEGYFKQGLEFASRGRALFSQARAQLSLAGLYVQYDRPVEAAERTQPALAFFRATGRQREAMQALLVLGGAQESLGQFGEAEKALLEAIRLGERIGDAENTGVARLYLSSVLAKSGRWPESMDEKNRSLAILGDMRGGLRAAVLLLGRGRLWAQIGRFQEASADFSQAQGRLKKLEGKQAQLWERLALGEAEAAGYQMRSYDAVRLARQAMALNGGTAENLEAQMVAGAAMIDSTSIESGIADCTRAIHGSEEKSQPYLAALGRLSLAEALRRNERTTEARPLAEDALAFFEPRRIWEAVWRCHLSIPGGDHARSAEAALNELKRLWPEEMVRSYLARPDMRKLAI
jgi:tetratricopeptide (TPR) repeat protein